MPVRGGDLPSHSGMQREPQQEYLFTFRVSFKLPWVGPHKSKSGVITIHKEDPGAQREAGAEITLKHRCSNTEQREVFSEPPCHSTARGLSSKEDQLWGLFPRDGKSVPSQLWRRCPMSAGSEQEGPESVLTKGR